MSVKNEVFRMYPEPMARYDIDIVNTGSKSIFIFFVDCDGYYDYIYYKVIVHVIGQKPEVLSTHGKKIYNNNIGAYFNHDGHRVYLKECYKLMGLWG